MNINTSINKLLFDHDCVIVPGLGGFVASPRPALHNKVHHTFIPPARVIAFNVFLKQNDGLLANYISREEKISFTEALNFLEKYVERCFMEMSAGRRFTIAEVGQLYYDAEKNIQFEPDDSVQHSLDSFGMAPVRAIPITSEERKESILLSPLRQSAASEKTRKAHRKTSGRKAMNVLLIAGIALWASFNLYIIAPKDFNLSNLNPFEKNVTLHPAPEVKTVPGTESQITVPSGHSDIVSAENKNPEATPVVQESVQSESVEVKKVDDALPAPPTSAGTVETTSNYFVVAGVFKVPSNAENFLAKLKSDGYEHSGSIERENKPTMVFVSRHAQRLEAQEYLQSLKEKGIEAWVYAGKN
jgi:hypothetical protein